MKIASPVWLLLLATNAFAMEDTLNRLQPPPEVPGGGPAAEIVELDLDESAKDAPASSPEAPPATGKPKSAMALARTSPDAPASDYTGAKVAGFATVLAGTLRRDLVLGPGESPALVKGLLVVPAGRTLTLQPGARLVVEPDPETALRLKDGMPSPVVQGQLWIVGRLAAEAAVLEGRGEAEVFHYGAETSVFARTLIKGMGLTQTAGVAKFYGCTFEAAKHYALAGGAAVLLHSTLRECGGLLAAYDGAPWALMAAECRFELCREALVLGSDPGPACLVFRHNNLEKTHGANLRAQPVRPPRRDKKGRVLPMEVLVGENWYGSAIPERIDARIVDIRHDAKLPARLNTRPPALAPYPKAGATLAEHELAAAIKAWEATEQRLLEAYDEKVKRIALAGK